MTETPPDSFEQVALKRGEELRDAQKEFNRTKEPFDAKYAGALTADQTVANLEKVGIPTEMAKKAIVEKIDNPLPPLSPTKIDTTPMYKIPPDEKRNVQIGLVEEVVGGAQAIPDIMPWRPESEPNWYDKMLLKLEKLMPWRGGPDKQRPKKDMTTDQLDELMITEAKKAS